MSVVQTSLQHKAQRNGDDDVTALLKGLHGAFWFAAGASFTAALIAAVVLRGMGSFNPKKPASTTTTESGETEAPTVRGEDEKAKLEDDKV